jgi:hypothetical protein
MPIPFDKLSKVRMKVLNKVLMNKKVLEIGHIIPNIGYQQLGLIEKEWRYYEFTEHQSGEKKIRVEIYAGQFSNQVFEDISRFKFSILVGTETIGYFLQLDGAAKEKPAYSRNTYRFQCIYTGEQW